MDAIKRWFPILGLLVHFLPGAGSSQTPEPVVHAILFYSPTCPHCHQVITEHLIPLQNQYGRRLALLGMDTSQQWANTIYWDAVRHFKIPEENWAVPLLIVGDQVLVGGFEIPNRFPSILEEGLAAGGIDLPDVPALIDFLKEQNALDPRYPDRLITRQSEEPQATEPQDSTSAEAGDSTPEAQAADSVGLPPEEDRPSAGVAETPALATDTTGTDDEPSDTSMAGARAPETTEGAETTPPLPSQGVEADSAVNPAPPRSDTEGGETTPGPGPRRNPSAQDSAGSSLGLGLEQAARELESMTMWDRFNTDRTGNSLSVLVLVFMVASLLLRGYPPKVKGREWSPWAIPVLVAVGVGVASYLSFIEVTHSDAVCGPVGDCNTVNQSEYAYLFGVLPVGVLGLLGYGVILVLWALSRTGQSGAGRWGTLGLWAAALFGTVFSVYLTFLEPFVIGATCAWCLTSAVIMTLILWAAGPPARRAWPGLALDGE